MAEPTSIPVRAGADLQRILDLPRRVYCERAARQLAERITPWFLNERGLEAWHKLLQLPPDVREVALADVKGPYAGRTPLRLQPEQAFMLDDYVKLNDWIGVGGLWASAPLGVGKTLFLYLAVLVSVERYGLKRPVVSCPGNLLGEVRSRFALYEGYFRKIQVQVLFVSFEKVWGVDSTHMLCHCEKCMPKGRVDDGGLRPDGFFIDEADRAATAGNIARKRMARFLSKHPIRCVFVTATPTGKGSINDFGWHAVAALKMVAPVPISSDVRREWSQALDTKPTTKRRPLGALGVVFGGLTWEESSFRDIEDPEDPDWQANYAEVIEERRLATLAGLSKRWRETPGFCVFTRASCETPLVIRPIPAPNDVAINKAFAPFRKFSETPTGEQVTDVFSQIALGGQLGAGLCHRMIPAPDQAYKDARRDAAAFVREVIEGTSRSRDVIDSEANVYRRYPNEPKLVKWRDLKNAVKRESVPFPFALSVVHAAANWLKANAPCIVYVFNTWVGEMIAKLAGVQYFSNHGKAPGGMRIEQLSGSSSAVVSAHSNRIGRDLYQWNNFLYVGTEQSGKNLDQLLGRGHRQGQLQAVYVTIMLLSAETIVALDRSLTDVTGANDHIATPSKLLAAEWDWSYVNPSLTSWETYATPEQIIEWDENDVSPPEELSGWRWCHPKCDVRDFMHRTKRMNQEQ